MRDQATSTGSRRQSMLIGKLHDGQGLWVSFDKRGDSYHPRYWSEAGKNLSLMALKGKVDFAKGLELSQFSSKRRTNKQKPHQDKQKLLIRQVYHQGGVLYEGDLEMIEALQAAKDKTEKQRRKISMAKSGKIQNTAPKKIRQIQNDSALSIEKFHINACSLPTTREFARHLRRQMLEHLTKTLPPTAVLLAALQHAHSANTADATTTPPYVQWQLREAHQFEGEDDEDGNDSDAGGEQREEEEEEGEGKVEEDDEEEDEGQGEEEEDEEEEEQEQEEEEDAEEEWSGLSSAGSIELWSIGSVLDRSRSMRA